MIENLVQFLIKRSIALISLVEIVALIFNLTFRPFSGNSYQWGTVCYNDGFLQWYTLYYNNVFLASVVYFYFRYRCDKEVSLYTWSSDASWWSSMIHGSCKYWTWMLKNITEIFYLALKEIIPMPQTYYFVGEILFFFFFLSWHLSQIPAGFAIARSRKYRCDYHNIQPPHRKAWLWLSATSGKVAGRQWESNRGHIFPGRNLWSTTLLVPFALVFFEYLLVTIPSPFLYL